jgi:hypothetical protein
MEELLESAFSVSSAHLGSCSWGASQQGQEPIDTEAEDATLLEALTKQRDWEHLSLCNSDLWI